jgi:hypothetical protein
VYQKGLTALNDDEGESAPKDLPMELSEESKTDPSYVRLGIQLGSNLTLAIRMVLKTLSTLSKTFLGFQRAKQSRFYSLKS